MPKYRALAFLFLLLATACARPAEVDTRQTEAHWLDGRWPYEKSELPRHETALYGRLDNGLRYIIQQNKKPEKRVVAQLNVQIGSLMERDNELGVAHFLEHMAFNGSKHFPPGALIPFFQKNGLAFGRDANAHTSFQETVYTLSLSSIESDNLAQGLLVMRDIADGLSILPEEVEKERGVILSEKVARDSTQYRAGRRMREKIYAGTRFVSEPIGEEEVIRTASAQTIRAFYDAWYRPELMIVVVVGDVQPAQVEQTIRNAFSDLQAHGQPRRIESWGDPDISGFVPYYDHYESEVTLVRIGALKPRNWRNDSEAVQRRMAYGAMANAILGNRLRQLQAEGKAPFLKAFARESEAFNLFPSVDLLAQCQAGQWRQTLAVLQDELRRVEHYGFLPEEVDEIRVELLRTYQLKAEWETDLSSQDVAKTLVACINGNRVYQSQAQTYAMYARFFNEATPQALHETFLGMWDSGNRLLSVTGSAVIEGDAEGELRRLWEEGQRRQVAAPVDRQALNYPYVPEPETPGTVIARSLTPIKDTQLTLHEIVFGNGLTLRMLPTRFSKGKSALSLHLLGGTDALDDARYVEARLAALADSESGFGRLSKEQERGLFRRTGFKMQTALGNESCVISGDGRTGDMEDILRAMWTQFLDPLVEEKDRRQMILRLAVADAGRSKDVPSAMRERSRQFFFGDALRTAPLTAEQARGVSLDRLRKALSGLRGGCGGVLNIVGDFDPGQAETLVARFFGASEVVWGKSVSRVHAYRPVFPAPLRPEMTFSVPASLAQAAIQVACHRDLQDFSDRRTLVVRRLLAAVLRDRLREKVREELGASYAPGAVYMLDGTSGFGMYLVRIETQPDKLTLLRKSVEEVLADLAASGVTQSELDRLRRPMLTGWMKERRENENYLRLLDAMARHEWPYLQWDAQFPGHLASVTPDDLNREARQAFVPEQRAVLIGTESPVNIYPTERPVTPAAYHEE